MDWHRSTKATLRRRTPSLKSKATRPTRATARGERVWEMKNERCKPNYAEQRRSDLGQRPEQPSVGDDGGGPPSAHRHAMASSPSIQTYYSKYQSLAFCELRYRDRRSTEIAISPDSYLEPIPSTLGAIAKYPALRGIDRKFNRKYYQYFLKLVNIPPWPIRHISCERRRSPRMFQTNW
eukprot:3436152-Pleurochrysis_carterae.AAC.1